MQILTVNAGSSSLRLALYRWRAGEVERVDAVHCSTPPDDSAPLHELLARSGRRVDAVAHRIVHGGELGTACLIDAAVEQSIERLSPLAPLHNPPALRWLRTLRSELDPSTPHVAVFDTGFFHDLPPVAARYPLPPDLDAGADAGVAVRRYGFHGSAHRAMWRAWCGRRADLDAGGRLLTLQLGAGCSAAAIDRGRAIDTSMGFTPLEGLMMATRAGDIDAGLVLHLQRRHGLDADAMERLLTRDSGLAGVSGLGGDMRRLLASDDPRAVLAVDMFCYRVRKYVGAYSAALGGIDGLVFGGGIGEHSAEVRRRILEGLDALGVVLDNRANELAADGDVITRAGSTVEARVIVVDEAAELVRASCEILNNGVCHGQDKHD